MARGGVLIEDRLHVRPVLSLAGKAEACRGAELPFGMGGRLPGTKDGPESRQDLDETPGRAAKHCGRLLEGNTLSPGWLEGLTSERAGDAVSWWARS